MILTKRILIHDHIGEDVTETYPAAEPVALVDIVPGDVVISFGAVQYGHSADHWRTPVASSRAAATLPKNVIVVLHPSRQTRRRQTFRRPTLPDLVHARA
jgi:hypothetical protein